MSDSREQCLNCQHDRSVHSIAGCSLCECRTPLLSGGNPTEVSAPSPSLSAREWLRKNYPYAALGNGGTVALIELLEAYAQSLQPPAMTREEAERQLMQTIGFSVDLCDDGIIKLWNFAVALLQRQPAPAVQTEKLVTMAAKIVEGLDSYCGWDGSDPYEGDDCPHEYIGLGLLENFRNALSAYQQAQKGARLPHQQESQIC